MALASPLPVNKWDVTLIVKYHLHRGGKFVEIDRFQATAEKEKAIYSSILGWIDVHDWNRMGATRLEYAKLLARR